MLPKSKIMVKNLYLISSYNSKNIKKSSIRQEIKWAVEVKKANELISENNIKKVNKYKIILTVLVSIILCVLNFRINFKFIPSYVTVGFSFNDHIGNNINLFESNMSLSSLIRGISLHEFLAIHYLLTNKDILFKSIRKILIYIIIRSLEKNIDHFKRFVFIVSQDYYGRSSSLISFEKYFNLNIVGLQHGLMPFNNIKKTNIYPGIRTKKQLVFNDDYKNIFTKKNLNQKISILGPPFDVNASFSAGLINICFVSNTTLENPEIIKDIELIKILCMDRGYNFTIRPHPQEIDNKLNFDSIEVSSKSQIRESLKNYVFIGIYSTFLYWAAFNGYKTVWLRGAPCGIEDEQMISKWPNTYFIDRWEIETSDKLKSIIDSPLIKIKSDKFIDRFNNAIRELLSE